MISFLNLALTSLLIASPANEPAAIRFEGNRAFSARVLMPLLGVRKNALLSEGQIQRGVGAIADYYHAQGFLDAAASWRFDSAAAAKTVIVSVQEGERPKVRQVQVTGARNVPLAELVDVITVRKNDYVIASDLSNARTSLTDLYRDRGFFFVQCSVAVRRIEERIPLPQHRTAASADVIFDLKEGPVCYVRRVNVRGNIRIRRRLIDRFVGIEPGERFSQSRVVAAQRRLYASRLLDRIYVTVASANTNDTARAAILSRATDSVDIRLDVAEIAPRSVGFGAGVQMLPWRALLSAEWEHLNVLGRGHSLRIGTEYSPVLGRNVLRDYRLNLDLLYRIPFVTRWAINLTTRPFGKWEHREGGYQLEYGAETGASHDFTPNLTAALFNRLHWVVYSDTSAALTEQPVQAITNSLSANLTADSRNDLFAPWRGGYLRPTVEVAGGLLGGDNRFLRFTFEGRYFRRVVFNHVLAVRGMAGAVLPYGGALTVPYYEQFYLGGANSLRGYDEKSIGPVVVAATAGDTQRYGNILLNTNIEFRSPLFPIRTSIIKGIGGAFFLDGGNVFGDDKGYAFGLYQLAAGAGLRVNTPIGPVRLDYGKRLTNPPAKDWGKIYFGILNLF